MLYLPKSACFKIIEIALNMIGTKHAIYDTRVKFNQFSLFVENDNNCVREGVLWCLLITDPYQCKHGKHNNQIQCIK